MNTNYNLIQRDDGALLLLIFENEYEKENVYFTVSKATNKLKLIYPNNKNIIISGVKKEAMRALCSRKKVLVSELDNKGDVSNGEITDCYYMEKINS